MMRAELHGTHRGRAHHSRSLSPKHEEHRDGRGNPILMEEENPMLMDEVNLHIISLSRRTSTARNWLI